MNITNTTLPVIRLKLGGVMPIEIEVFDKDMAEFIIRAMFPTTDERPQVVLDPKWGAT